MGFFARDATVDLKIKKQELEDQEAIECKGVGSKIEIIGSAKGVDLSQTYVRDASDIEGVASGIGELIDIANRKEVGLVNGLFVGPTKEGCIYLTVDYHLFIALHLY